MLKAVVDTNMWIRGLLGGETALPLLDAWYARRFSVCLTGDLLDELQEVSSRTRLAKRIVSKDSRKLLHQLTERAEFVTPSATTPACRDPDDIHVLAAAIGGRVDAIVSADSDLRGDDQLRREMEALGIRLCGVDGFLAMIADDEQSRQE